MHHSRATTEHALDRPARHGIALTNHPILADDVAVMGWDTAITAPPDTRMTNDQWSKSGTAGMVKTPRC